MILPNEFTLEQSQQIIDVIKHCQVLGIRVLDVARGELKLELPYSDSIVGNPDTGVIHGGALSTLLDTACGMSASLSFDYLEICPTLDLRIDYMGAAKPGKPIIAHAQVYRTTNNIVFSRGKAFQEDEQQPVAHCVATFMRLPDAKIENVDKMAKVIT